MSPAATRTATATLGATATSTPTPAPPAGLTATSNGYVVTLNWTPPAGDPDGYVVDRSTNGSTFSTVAVLGGDVTEYVNQPIATGSGVFYYRVRAKQNPSYSAPSNVVRVVLPVTTAAQTATASANFTATPTVPITPSATPTLTPTRTATPSRTATPTAPAALTSTATPTQPAVPTSTATPTQPVVPTLTATPTQPAVPTPIGTATASPTRTVTATRTATPTRTATATRTPTPVPPSGLAASVSGYAVTLSWADPGTNPDGYVVDRSSNGTTFSTIKVLAAGVTELVDQPISAGSGVFYYRVRAKNNLSYSAPSNVVRVVLPK